LPSPDHHSAYLAQAVAALTPEGHRRVDELLEQLETSAAGRRWVTEFAKARKTEADLATIDTGAAAEPAVMLSEQEFDVLATGFATIRDTEQLDDVASWANAVLALLEDERARTHLH
jgi:hypothetical protein